MGTHRAIKMYTGLTHAYPFLPVCLQMPFMPAGKSYLTYTERYCSPDERQIEDWCLLRQWAQDDA